MFLLYTIFVGSYHYFFYGVNLRSDGVLSRAGALPLTRNEKTKGATIMNEDKLRLEWESLVYHIEFTLDKKVHYDTEYSKKLIYHSSVNKLLKSYNEELLKHDVDYWVNLIYGEREFIHSYLEAYRILKDYYSVPEDTIEILRTKYFSKDHKENLLTSSPKSVVDEVLIKHYGVTNTSIYKIGKKTNGMEQKFTVNYIKARNPVEAKLKAEEEFGFSEKVDEWLFTGYPVYVFVEQILDVNLEYEKISRISADMEANIKLKNRLKERLDTLQHTSTQ